MQRFVLSVAVLLTLIALATSAWAYPSLNGTTGTGNLPTAEVTKANATTLAFDSVQTSSTDAKSWRLINGSNDHFEWGGNLVSTQRTTWGLNAKYLASVKETGNTAVGALFGTTSEFTILPIEEPVQAGTRDAVGPPSGSTLPRTNTYQLYAVHGFKLMAAGSGHPGLTVNLGANWTAMSAVGINSDGLRGFASMQATVGKSTLAVDYQTKSDRLDHDAMWSAVLRQSLGNRGLAEVGYGNSLGVLGGSSNRFFAGVGFEL